MAEMDSRDRRDNRGGDRGGDRYGGGRGGGGNRRKRAREDDDFDQGGRNQRQRSDAPPGTRIRKALLEIGEDANGRAPRPVKEAATTTAKLTADNWEDEYVKETFCSVILRTVLEQPLKIVYVAAVVLYGNAERSDIGRTMIDRAKPMLQEAAETGNWRDFKLVLRFLTCLSQLFEEDAIMPLLDELFGRAVDAQTASSEDTVGIELVKIILLTIPYLIASTNDESMQQKASELLEKTEIVASTPHPLEELVDPYPSKDEQEKPMGAASIISLLQRQLQDEAANGWKLSCIPRVYDPSPVKLEDETNGDSEPKTATRHSFPTIDIPSPVNPGPKVLFPELYFSLYADQEVESVPPTANIAACLVRDVTVDTLNILDFNRNAAAKLLNEIDNFWTPGTFARRETPFDRIRDVPEGQPSWKPEDVAVDSIFSQIFQLPTSERRLVYYHSLITELCKISPQAIAPSLGRAIRFLFRHVDVMDMELSYRFLDWFAHHLSNFEFRWKWTEWTPDLELSEIHPKKAFINGALDKEIRLSFAKRIRETLPKDFQPLVPESKEKDMPEFKYSQENEPYAKEGAEVLALLRKKAPEEEVQRVLNSVNEQAKQQGVTDPLTKSTNIYMTSICNIGSKSLSHVLSTIDRCRERLLSVGENSDAARREIISAVIDFWVDHPGNAVNIVDKLLNYTIIKPMDVIEWALKDRLDRGRALASDQVYELISKTINKVIDRIHQILEQRGNTALPFAQRQQIDEVLPRERQGMRDLFAAIEDAVSSVASGSQDEMIERFDGDSVERDLIMLWGERWAKVWRRKAAVEETVVGEAAVPPLVEPEPVEDTGVEHDMDTADEVL